MKITPIDHQPAATAPVAERKTAGEPVPAVQPSATVQLSSQVALADEHGRAEFDQAKVERIAQAIRDGRFQVNAEVIADKLIANAQELLPKARH
jgi:negative regulator of flagellin synthesis FlgM